MMISQVQGKQKFDDGELNHKWKDCIDKKNRKNHTNDKNWKKWQQQVHWHLLLDIVHYQISHCKEDNFFYYLYSFSKHTPSHVSKVLLSDNNWLSTMIMCTCWPWLYSLSTRFCNKSLFNVWLGYISSLQIASATIIVIICLMCVLFQVHNPWVTVFTSWSIPHWEPSISYQFLVAGICHYLLLWQESLLLLQGFMVEMLL